MVDGPGVTSIVKVLVLVHSREEGYLIMPLRCQYSVGRWQQSAATIIIE